MQKDFPQLKDGFFDIYLQRTYVPWVICVKVALVSI